MEKSQQTTQKYKLPLLCLEGVPDLPVAPQNEAGLTMIFQTWPRFGPWVRKIPGEGNGYPLQYS